MAARDNADRHANRDIDDRDNDVRPPGADQFPAGAENYTSKGRLKNHILSRVEYQDIVPDPVVIPEREDIPYIRLPMADQTFVEARY